MNNYFISPQFDKNKFFIVNLSEIEERLDPFFYKPIFRNSNSYKNVQFQKLSSLTKSIHHPPEYERIYSENGFQLLRAQNVRPTGIELDNNQVFFSEETLKGKTLVHPEIGDVLVVRSGVNAGDTAVIEKKYENVIIGADNLLIKVNDKIIPKFLQVFFYTSFGKNLMSRYLTGATNKHINPYNLGKIPIPFVNRSKQEKVIEIFENGLLQKKLKESAAEKILTSIDDYWLEQLRINLITHDNQLSNRIFIKSFKELSGGRLDPNYYSKDFAILELLFSKHSYTILDKLSIQISDSPHERPDFTDEIGIRLIMIEHLKPDGILRTNEKYITEEYHKKLQSTQLLRNDLLMVRIGVTTGTTSIADDFFDGANISGNITLIRLNSKKINVQYVLHYLNSYLGKLYTKKILSNSARDFLTVAKIKSIKIPILNSILQKEIADHITDLRRQAQQLKDNTKVALAKASKEIEEILLG